MHEKRMATLLASVYSKGLWQISLVVFVFGVVAAVPVTYIHNCPSGWGKHGTSCYYFGLSKHNWQGSKAQCARFGAFLTEITSDEEQTFLSTFLSTRPATHQGFWWIGGAYRNEQWVWDHSGLPLSGYWDHGYPKYRHANCMQLHVYKDSYGVWRNAYTCDHHNYFICEKPVWCPTYQTLHPGCKLLPVQGQSCYKLDCAGTHGTDTSPPVIGNTTTLQRSTTQYVSVTSPLNVSTHASVITTIKPPLTSSSSAKSTSAHVTSSTTPTVSRSLSYSHTTGMIPNASLTTVTLPNTSKSSTVSSISTVKSINPNVTPVTTMHSSLTPKLSSIPLSTSKTPMLTLSSTRHFNTTLSNTLTTATTSTFARPPVQSTSHNSMNATVIFNQTTAIKLPSTTTKTPRSTLSFNKTTVMFIKTAPSTSMPNVTVSPHSGTTKAMVTIPPRDITCAICAGPPEACELAFYENTCQPPNHYCINHVTNMASGQRLVERRCGNIHDCYHDWYLGSSDDDKCRQLSATNILTYNFECSYCCIKDSCNVDLHPKHDTLYQPKRVK